MAKEKTSKSDVSAAEGDVASRIEEEQAKGYWGVKVDPEPNEAYTLKTGPDSPGRVPDDRTAITHTHIADATEREAAK